MKSEPVRVGINGIARTTNFNAHCAEETKTRAGKPPHLAITRSHDLGQIVVVVSDDVFIDADFACVSVTMPKEGARDDLHLLRRTCEGFARFRRNSEKKTVMSWERPGSM